jgi:hypothetical protein
MTFMTRAASASSLQTLPKWADRLLPIFIVLLTGGGIVWLQVSRLAQLEARANQPQTKAEYLREEQQTQTGLQLLAKMPALGFNNLIADWSFLSFIQYFGDDKARPQTGYRITPDFFKLAVDRDPRFLGMYSYLSAGVTLYGGKPQETVRLLQQGAASIPPVMQPDAYFLWQAKGTDELLFLGRSADARRSYETVADWASQSPKADLQAIAARSHRTAQFLASNPDSRRARVGSWFNILTNAIDDPTRRFALRQIKALGGTISVQNGALQVKLPKQD